jgi:hypothetical protein
MDVESSCLVNQAALKLKQAPLRRIIVRFGRKPFLLKLTGFNAHSLYDGSCSRPSSPL